MKNYKRGERRFTKYNKYKRRIKKFINYWDYKWFEEESGIKRSSWKDMIEQHRYTYFKTMSTTCSCSGCAYYKYNRDEFKKEFKRILKEEELD